MKKLLLYTGRKFVYGVIINLAFSACLFTNAFAQPGRSTDLSFGDHEGMTIESQPKGDRPSIGGRDSSGGSRNGGTPAAPTPRDPYPALTKANNAYREAVAHWEQAYQKYQEALAKQRVIREKYVDANNNVRPGFDYYTAVAVVRAADNEALDAWYELDRAEKERNLFSSRAAEEFRKASEQFSRDEKARQDAENARRAAPAPSQRRTDPCPRC
jgi:hypothetical protein